MNCIKCNGTLNIVNIDGIEVDQCDNCSGIWFDLGELDDILKTEDISKLKNQVENNKHHDSLEVSCPRCGGNGKMVRVTSLKDNTVHIDTCMICYGRWLDGGELEKLKNANISLSEKIKDLTIS